MMAWTVIHKQGAKNEQGVEVSFDGRFRLKYSDPTKGVIVFAEEGLYPDPKPELSSVLIWVLLPRKWEIDEKHVSPFTPADLEEYQANVTEALAVLGCKPEFHIEYRGDTLQ